MLSAITATSMCQKTIEQAMVYMAVRLREEIDSSKTCYVINKHVAIRNARAWRLEQDLWRKLADKGE